jgi:hypothetical protein
VSDADRTITWQSPPGKELASSASLSSPGSTLEGNSPDCFHNLQQADRSESLPVKKAYKFALSGQRQPFLTGMGFVGSEPCDTNQQLSFTLEGYQLAFAGQ